MQRDDFRWNRWFWEGLEKTLASKNDRTRRILYLISNIFPIYLLLNSWNFIYLVIWFTEIKFFIHLLIPRGHLFIYLRCWQIFTITLPPSRRQFFTTIRWQNWTIFDPSHLKNADVLNGWSPILIRQEAKRRGFNLISNYGYQY